MDTGIELTSLTDHTVVVESDRQHLDITLLHFIYSWCMKQHVVFAKLSFNKSTFTVAFYFQFWQKMSNSLAKNRRLDRMTDPGSNKSYNTKYGEGFISVEWNASRIPVSVDSQCKKWERSHRWDFTPCWSQSSDLSACNICHIPTPTNKLCDCIYNWNIQLKFYVILSCGAKYTHVGTVKRLPLFDMASEAEDYPCPLNFNIFHIAIEWLHRLYQTNQGYVQYPCSTRLETCCQNYQTVSH